MKKTLQIFCLLVFAFCKSSFSQTTFQKIFTQEGDVECFGAYQTSDDGFIFTGIATVSGVNKVFLTRTNCHGDILWSKTYANAGTWNNISQRVIETHDHGFLLAASIGSFGSYNILIVRTTANGVSLWKKTMSGSGDDGVNSVIETTTQDYIIAGSTSTYGQDANSFYKDVYLMKLDDSGNLLWGKTYGTKTSIDEAFDVIETYDGHYAATGRYLVQGTLQCFLLKTDVDGNKVFLKSYGDTLQHTTGYGLANTLDGGYIITGSSTLTKNSFQDYPDEFLIKTNADGDTLWCRSYHGSSIDGSENGSSVVVTPDGSYAMGVATFSYPSIGFVPNKHCVLKTDKNGHMEFCRAYNQGGSHYPYLTASKGSDGYVISGFSNFYTPLHFSATLIKLDTAFHSGCNETDETDLTYEEHMPAKINEPDVFTSSGGILINSVTEGDFTLNDTTLCFSSLDSCFVFNEVNDLQFENEIVEVYPNPANEVVFLHFNTNNNQVFSLNIFNQTGELLLKKMMKAEIGENEFQFELEDFSSGLFYIKLFSETFSYISKLIVIKYQK
jgi:hypothetical protein